jgi:hypothetical protein
MKIWLYIFVTLLFIAGIGAYVYTLTQAGHTLDVFGVTIHLPVAVWFMLPMLLLLMYTLLYMFINGFRGYLQTKRWQRDSNTLNDALYWSLMNEPKKQKYALKNFSESLGLLEVANISLSRNIKGLNERLSKAVRVIQKIQSGEYVDLKAEKMSKVFNPGNPYLIQNRLNRLEEDEKFVDEVLRSTGKYSPQVKMEALHTFAKRATFDEARKYVKLFDKEAFFILLERVSLDEKLGLTVDILDEFISVLKVECSDYLRVVNQTKKIFPPQENLAIFERYQRLYSEAQHAYLYLLFEYELLDEVKSYFEEYDENDFMKFRALYILKKEHTGFKLEDVLDIDSLCKK